MPKCKIKQSGESTNCIIHDAFCLNVNGTDVPLDAPPSSTFLVVFWVTSLI